MCRGYDFKDVTGRLVLVECVVLGKDAHPDLVERRGPQSSQGIFFQLLPLMDPCVAGGTDGVEGGPVGIGKMVAASDPDRTVVRPRGLHALKLPLSSCQFPCTALDSIPPGSRRVGHETDAIDAVSVVESTTLDRPILELEQCFEGNFQKGIARLGPVESKLKDIPPLHLRLVSCHRSVCSRFSYTHLYTIRR